MKCELNPGQKWEALAEASGFRAGALAQLCGVSLRTLQRHFQKQYQLTVSSWMRGVRLQEAYSRLKAGQTIKQAAFDLGYKQLSHFSRDFKMHFGVSPRFLARLSLGTEVGIVEVPSGETAYAFPA